MTGPEPAVPAPTAGRERQRRRTRRAIVDATADFLREGKTPTIAEIADRAEVSRRTIHMYFPTLEQLLLDAAIGVTSEQLIEADMAASRSGDDPEERVVALARAIVRHEHDVMHLGRTMIRLTVDGPEPASGEPRRGARRIGWIEEALAPARPLLRPEVYRQLVSSLAMVIGWEAMIVLWDVRGLNRKQAEDATVWAVRALVGAALAET